ncbi:AraC family transcriptional regulator [Mucilaginibacter sp. dw_454]|uniref:helix-turn-helix domain-containing protein n=1 Tax=Mucilaginibacter sp. dw_454 TaxID=2720079 RepID=UPI001BD47E56|nr:AraC family transcriptional regulator [Mucilaginibacter sp. dw_454]
MVIYNLPDDFNSAEEQGKPVIIRSHQSSTRSANNKSIIHQNMVDIIIAGKKTIIDAYNITSLEAGEIMILSKGSSLISQALPQQGPFHNLAIYFTNEVLADFWIKYTSGSNGSLKENAKQPFITYHQDVFIRNFVNSVLLLLELPAKLSDQLKLLKLEELLLYLFQTNPEKLQSLSMIAKDNEEMQLRKAAESHITTPISLDELAFLCNTSLSTFKRKFLNIYGTSPQRWLTRQKMHLAANLLKHPQERPGSVYAQVGYANQSSFILAFKKEYGVTPKEYQLRNLS